MASEIEIARELNSRLRAIATTLGATEVHDGQAAIAVSLVRIAAAGERAAAALERIADKYAPKKRIAERCPSGQCPICHHTLYDQTVYEHMELLHPEEPR